MLKIYRRGTRVEAPAIEIMVVTAVGVKLLNPVSWEDLLLDPMWCMQGGRKG